MNINIYAILIFTFFLFKMDAQTIEEPEFIGESILLKSDNTTVPLEKQLTQSRSVASTGLILTGIGKFRQQIQIDGCCANIKFAKSDNVKIIIRSVDNLSDPLSVIKIFKFEQKKNYRRAELLSASTLGSIKNNNLQYITFVGKKFGASSYILQLNSIQPGEYGITISNPNNLDQKQTITSTFAVID